MRPYFTAFVLGLALAAAWLGVGAEIAGRSGALQEQALTRPESRAIVEGTTASGPPHPASHSDASTEAIGVALNPNLIAGRHTVICTSDPTLFDELVNAVDIWNSRLAGLKFGSPAGPLRLHTSGGKVPRLCTDTNQLDIHVQVLRGTCMNANANACYRHTRACSHC